MRTCSKCEEIKPEDNFSKCSKNKDGLSLWCKLCFKNYNSQSDKKEKASLSYKERSVMPGMKEKRALLAQTLGKKFITYKHGAKVRGHAFNLTKDEFSSFWQVPCTYCGSEVATIGIDRIDSSIGYSIDNCVSCCAMCNTMKLNHSLDEWLDKMKQILKHRGII